MPAPLLDFLAAVASSLVLLLSRRKFEIFDSKSLPLSLSRSRSISLSFFFSLLPLLSPLHVKFAPQADGSIGSNFLNDFSSAAAPENFLFGNPRFEEGRESSGSADPGT